MRIIKLLTLLLSCVFSTFILAASPQKLSIPPRKTAPWYLGIGHGFSSILANYSHVVLDAPSADPYGYYYEPASYKAVSNDLFPMVQLGCWDYVSPTVLWGVKAFYKYLGASTHYTLSSDLLHSNQDLKIKHDIAVVLTLGVSIRQLTPYIGLGAMWLPRVHDVYHATEDVDDIRVGIDNDVKKSLLGGLVQLGVLYNIGSRWFVDVVYSYGLTNKVAFNKTVFAQTLNRDIRITTQELAISVNRRF